MHPADPRYRERTAWPNLRRPQSLKGFPHARPRQTAVLRLITLWATRSADDDAFSSRIALGDILQDNVVDIVPAGDPFADPDAPANSPRRTTARCSVATSCSKPGSHRAEGRARSDPQQQENGAATGRVVGYARCQH